MTMKPRKYTLEEAQQMARRDRNRMIVLVVGAMLIGGAYFMSADRSDERRRAAEERQSALLGPDGRVPTKPVEVVPFDDEAALAAIRDGSEEARLTLDAEALVPAYAYARMQTAAHFDAMGIRDLDVDVFAELAAAPADHRLDALRARGQVLDVERRRREGGTRDDWLVTVRGADGALAHLLFANAPRGEGGEGDVAVGDHLRLDGLFFKLLRREVGSEWLEGPLVLGHQAVASFPPIDDRLARTAPALADVVDDEIGAVGELEQDALWQLMARARLEDGETDWAGAPELDEATLGRLYTDGDTYRGTAFRIPISRNLDTWPEAAEENPLGLDRMTTGWLGNATWRTPVGVLKWHAPYDWEHLMRREDDDTAQLITARGWFLKNIVYTTAQGKPARVPLFVFADVERFVPSGEDYTTWLVWGVLGLTVGLVVLITFLLRADKRRSAELQEELTRRRRARRQKDGQSLSGAASS